MNTIKIFITGGTGFLGEKLVKQFNELNNETNGPKFKVFFNGRNLKLGQKIQDENPNTLFIPSDISAPLSEIKQPSDSFLSWDAIIPILEECNYVFHCAAKCEAWGKYDDFYNCNYVSTTNLASVCNDIRKKQLFSGKEPKLKAFVFVSTPSIFTPLLKGGKTIIIKSDTKPPRLEEQLNHYSSTKLMAEEFCQKLFQNDEFPLVIMSTFPLRRPRAIFGEGDKTLMPQLLAKISKQKVPFLTYNRMVPSAIPEFLGCGACDPKFKAEKDKERHSIMAECMTDLTYVENIFYFFKGLVEKCENKEFKNFGKSYNLTNGEAVKMWDIIKRCWCDVCGFTEKSFDSYVKNSKLDLPLDWAYGLAHGLEKVYDILGIYDKEPPFTRYNIMVLGGSVIFDSSDAIKEVGYAPKVSTKDSIDRTIQWFKQQEKLKKESKKGK